MPALPGLRRAMRAGAASLTFVLLGVVACSSPPARAPLQLVDLEGLPVDPFDSSTGIDVFLFTRTDCPVSNRYAPTVRRLFEEFAPRGVSFRLVYVDPDETAEVIRQHLDDYAYPLPALRDPEHKLVALTGATITPEAVVFGGGRRMIYRGRIDDWYLDFGRSRATATTHDLERAIQAALAGQAVEPSTTEAVGCFIADLK